MTFDFREKSADNALKVVLGVFLLNMCVDRWGFWPGLRNYCALCVVAITLAAAWGVLVGSISGGGE